MVEIPNNALPRYIHTQYKHREKRSVIHDNRSVATDLITESTGFQVLVQLDRTKTARGELNCKCNQALAHLIDDITEMYDDAFRYTGI